MIHFASRACVLAAVALTASASVAQVGLYAVGQFDGLAGQSLYSVNTTTGQATAIGNTGLFGVIDIAFDPSANRLLALTQGGDRYAIDTATAQATLVANVVDFIPEGGLAINASGTLYTTNFDDLHMATATSGFGLVGASGLNVFDVSGLAFVNNQLFGLAANGTDADALVRYNTTTGSAEVIASLALTNTEGLAGLAWDFTGSSVFASSDSALFRIDTQSGAVTSIGAFGIQGVSGIAYIPAPGAAGLLVAMGIAGARRRRR